MTVPNLDLIKNLPQDKALHLLKTTPENQWFERKSSRVTVKKLAQLVCAFANTEGGLITIGIEDKELLPLSRKKVNEFRRQLRESISPVPRQIFHELKITSDETILLIEVPQSAAVHYTSDRECYIRTGDSTIKLSQDQLMELEYDRGARNFEDTLSQSSINDLDSSLLGAYANKIGASNPEQALFARGMTNNKNRVSICGLLLFSDNPQRELPTAVVRILKYSDNDRGTGRTQTLISGSDIRCEGSITTQIATAIETVNKLIPRHRILGEDGKFIDQPIIPKGAWTEGIVNAVVHRSYSISGDYIRVEIFPNRIEITSPGRFPGLADPTKPSEIRRHARNPRIARACAELDITQELGEGIRRIFAEMREVGLVDPTYRQTSQNVILTLHALDSISDEIRKSVGPAIQTLEKLRSVNRPLGTGEIIELTNLTRQTVLRHLKTLRDKGLVKWEGNSPNDPQAIWRLL